MKKRALRKDFFMEIRKSFNRFASIFFIVALGVAFFAGLQAAAPDMRSSGDTYFDTENMMDLKVIGTLGLTDADVEALEALDGIETAEGAWMTDVLYGDESNQKVLHIESIAENFQNLRLSEGVLPEAVGECMIDDEMASKMGVSVGDVLVVEESVDDDEDGVLATHAFTVTGIGNSPYYVSLSRGNTTLGSGEVSGVLYVIPDTFDMDVYTQIWLSAAGAEELNAFEDAYPELIDQVEAQAEGIEEVRCQARYDEIMEEADEKIAEGREKLEDAKQELEDGKQEADEKLAEAKEKIEDAETKLADGKQEVEDGKQELEDAKMELEDSKQEVEDGKQEIEDGWKELEEKKQELEDAKAELAEGRQQLDAARQQAADGRSELSTRQAELDSAAAQVSSGWSQLTDAKNTLYAQEEAYMASVAQLDEAEAALDAAQAELNQKASELESSKLQLDAAWAEYAAQKAALEAAAGTEEGQIALQMAQPQLEAARVSLESSQAELESGQAQINNSQLSIDEQRASVAAGREELVSARASLDAAWAEVNSQESALNDAQAQVDSGAAQIAAGSSELSSGEAEIASNEAQLASAEQQIADAEQQIADAEKEIEENEEKLAEGKQEYEDAKAEADEKIADGEQKIADAEQELADAEAELADIEVPEWSISTREDLTDYTGYGDNADRMKSIAQVFPALFFLVAALISLTTMTRMVEEQRTQIGTLKALGYGKVSIAMKYLCYALLATLGGSVLGVLLGQKFLPFVIITAYGILYPHMYVMELPYQMGSAGLATGIAVCCTLVATIASCWKVLLDTPASLMRPPTPKEGKRVLLEHIGFVWRHLSFSWKSTIRNLFRYKKRFFMTIFGIGGCMALLLVGFGLRDSIMDVAILQYQEIQLYDATIIEDEDATAEEKAELTKALEEHSEVTAQMSVFMKKMTMKNGKNTRDVYLMVPETTENLSDFVTFRHRETKETFTLENQGVILGEKTAKLLDVSVGDTFVIMADSGKEIMVTVGDICENYMLHYAYMSPELYAEAFGEEPEFNNRIFCTDLEDEAEIEKVGTDLLKQDAALSISYTATVKERLDDMLGTLDSVIIVLIVSAGMLAFVVLYNLNNININERKRELATIKVLGFYDGEVSAYVYRENVLLTFIGAALGIFLGFLLHRYVILTVEVDECMFGRNIKMMSNVYAMILTCGFSLIVNFFMHFKLKKIDMVESLKSVE
ncbi:MAG: FtsX-like permease family protein [Eubacteriales bacterium]|nr:FtsX-like permease family protein [Eubacteriales bacterium]